MTFKFKGKDNLGVLSVGVAYAVANVALAFIKIIVNVVSAMIMYSDKASPSEIIKYFWTTYLASGQYWADIGVGLVVNFVVGALFAIIYNLLINKHIFKKY